MFPLLLSLMVLPGTTGNSPTPLNNSNQVCAKGLSKVSKKKNSKKRISSKQPRDAEDVLEDVIDELSPQFDSVFIALVRKVLSGEIDTQPQYLSEQDIIQKFKETSRGFLLKARPLFEEKLKKEGYNKKSKREIEAILELFLEPLEENPSQRN